MTAKRTARSVKIADFSIPAAEKVSLGAAQSHRNVRQHLFATKKQILPDMITVEVRPGKDEGSWQIEVWECPDE